MSRGYDEAGSARDDAASSRDRGVSAHDEAGGGGSDDHSGRDGIGLALAAALLFGISTPLAKILLGDLRPQLLAGLLYLGSGLGLGCVWIVRRLRQEQRREAPLTRDDLPWLVGAVAIGGVAAPLLLLFGLERTAASSAALLLNLEGVATAAIAWLVFRENIDLRIATGMTAICAGGAVLAWQGSPSWDGLSGPLLVVGACVAWAIDNNLTQKISGADPVQTSAIKGLAAGSVNLVIAGSMGWPHVPALPLAAALALGLASYGTSLVCYLRALRAIGTARTGAYFSLAPFVGALVAVAVWREPLTPPSLIAAALMCAGVWLHATERHHHVHCHDPLLHVHLHVHDEHHRAGHRHGPDDPAVTDPLPHAHRHRHQPLVHTHVHYPDLHHRHGN